MLTDYTLTEMRRQWLVRLGAYNLNCGVESSADDLLTAWLDIKIRDWYWQLLRSAPASDVNTRDVKAELQEVGVTPRGVLTISYPLKGVRPVSLTLEGCERQITEFVGADSSGLTIYNMLAQQAGHAPVIAVDNGRCLQIHGYQKQLSGASESDTLLGKIIELTMVAEPLQDDTFPLHPSLLSTIESYIAKNNLTLG